MYNMIFNEDHRADFLGWITSILISCIVALPVVELVRYECYVHVTCLGLISRSPILLDTDCHNELLRILSAPCFMFSTHIESYFNSYCWQYNNVTKRNCDGVPSVMVVSQALCSCSWLVYGYLINDPNVAVSWVFWFSSVVLRTDWRSTCSYADVSVQVFVLAHWSNSWLLLCLLNRF